MIFFQKLCMESNSIWSKLKKAENLRVHPPRYELIRGYKFHNPGSRKWKKLRR